LDLDLVIQQIEDEFPRCRSYMTSPIKHTRSDWGVYDRPLALYCRLSVSLSVSDDIMYMYCGDQGRCRGLKVIPSSRRVLPRTGLAVHFFKHVCCRMYRLATNSEKDDGHQKQTLVPVAMPNGIHSTIGYHSNRWDSCIYLCVFELVL